MRRASTLVLCLSLVLAAAPGSADDGQVPAAALAAAIASTAPPLVIDVRSPEEYASGHVPGAILMPVQSFPSAVSQLPAAKDQPIIVYCEMGPRAGLAKAALVYAGYSNVQYLEGHMRAWRSAGLELEK